MCFRNKFDGRTFASTASAAETDYSEALEALDAPPIDAMIVNDERLAKGLMDRGLLNKSATPEQISKAVKAIYLSKIRN